MKLSVLKWLGVCATVGFVVTSGFIALNVTRLAQAESLADDFVRDALAQGSGMALPPLAPTARDRFWLDGTKAELDHARDIGPLASVDRLKCGVQTDPANLCGGQLSACVVDGQGQKGAFQAAIALCRAGDLTSYRIAGAKWHFAPEQPAPDEAADRDAI